MLLEDPVPEVGNVQPLRGDNARWAGIDGVTMVVYSLATSEAGGPASYDISVVTPLRAP